MDYERFKKHTHIQCMATESNETVFLKKKWDPGNLSMIAI